MANKNINNSNKNTKVNKDKVESKNKNDNKPKRKIKVLKIIMHIVMIGLICFGTYKYSYYTFEKGSPIQRHTVKNVTMKYLNDKFKDYSFEIKEIIYDNSGKSFNIGLQAKDKEGKTFLFGVSVKDNKVDKENFQSQKLNTELTDKVNKDISSKINIKVESVQAYFNADTINIPTLDLDKLNLPITIVTKIKQNNITPQEIADKVVTLNKAFKELSYFKNVQVLGYLVIDDTSSKEYNIGIENKNIDISKEDILTNKMINASNLNPADK